MFILAVHDDPGKETAFSAFIAPSSRSCRMLAPVFTDFPIDDVPATAMSGQRGEPCLR